MAYFKLVGETESSVIELIIKAACVSCARSKAVDLSAANEVVLWRDPAKSKIKLLEILPEGVPKNGVILQRKVIAN